MFKNTVAKLKADWLVRNEAKLCVEFESQIQSIKDSLTVMVSDWNKKRDSLLREIETESQNLSLQQNEYAILLKKLEAGKKNVEDQIKMLEAKSTPTNIWTEAFTSGFNKAWDIMIPIMQDGVLKSKKFIEDEAIQDTLRRINGNDKKVK